MKAQLAAVSLDDIAGGCVVYRRHHAELRAAKGLIGVSHELKLNIAAVTVLVTAVGRRTCSVTLLAEEALLVADGTFSGGCVGHECGF